jgi:hypothetical protein
MTPLGDVYEKTGAGAWTVRGNIAGPQGLPGQSGGLEVARLITSTHLGPTGIGTTFPGMAYLDLGSVTTRNVPHYFEVFAYQQQLASPSNLIWALYDGTIAAPGSQIAVGRIFTPSQGLPPAAGSTSLGTGFIRVPFTPPAGTRSYHVRLVSGTGGANWDLHNDSIPLVIVLREASIGSVPLISPPLIQGPTTLPTADYPGQRMTYWLASSAIYGDRPQSAKHWDLVWNPTAWWYMGGPTLRRVSNSDMTGWSPPSTWIPSPQPQVTVPEKGIYIARASWEATCPGVTNFSLTTRSRIASVVTQSAYQADSSVPLAGNYQLGEMDWHPLGAATGGSVIDKGSIVDIAIWGGRSDIAFRYLTLEVVPIYITN